MQRAQNYFVPSNLINCIILPRKRTMRVCSMPALQLPLLIITSRIPRHIYLIYTPEKNLNPHEASKWKRVQKKATCKKSPSAVEFASSQ